MSQRSKNQKEVNTKLIELNEKYIPDNNIILNTSPPRVGKTINTIIYHFENDIPAIVFVDGEDQANDIKADLQEILKSDLGFLHYWQPKGELCHIFQNKKEIIEKHGEEFFDTISFKYENGIGICDKCEYKMPYQWDIQKDTSMRYDILIMNKDNIKTPLIKDSHFYTYIKLFYKYNIDEDEEISRTIIYDEKLEKLYIEKFKELEDHEIDLLNKIISLTNHSIDVIVYNNWDLVEKIEIVKEILENRPTNAKILKEIDFNFKKFGELDPKIYLEILFNKLKINNMIYDYLEDKPALPIKNGKINLDFFTYEELYIDILFERIDKHKIILLDATPLQPIVEKIKTMDGFTEIKLDLDIFDKKSSLLRISRNGKFLKNSRSDIKDKCKEAKINNILEYKAYTPIIDTNRYIKEFKELENIKFGVVSYQSRELENTPGNVDEINVLKTLKEKLPDIYTLYFGNTRGRSELNNCDILYISGTDRHPPPSKYNIYRYLGGNKTFYDLKRKEGGVSQLTFNDELFNQIINHQIDSEMEQVIFRNMPHMKKRLTIIEGHLPKHLTKYFKKIAKINMHKYTQENLFPNIIKHFLKTIYLNKSFDFEEVNRLTDLSFKTEEEIKKEISNIEKQEYRDKVLKIAKKYLSPKYKKKYGCVPKGIFDYLNKNHTHLMNKAKIKSL